MSKESQERRKYKRLDLTCPAAVCDADGDVLIAGRTVNLSDGGVYLSVPAQETPALSKAVRVKLNLPRSTANTYMVEDVSCKASVIRHQPMVDASLVGVAIRFGDVQRLQLEV